jgi:tRNA nucleotidyltransferase (CCA-adding enzyme)
VVDDLAARLVKSAEPTDLDLLRLIATAADQLGTALYAVGGLPRDLLLGQTPRDFDLVVEGNAIKLADLLAVRHGGGVFAHRRFGTATWRRKPVPGRARKSNTEPASDLDVDLVTARTETYPHPAQLPQVRPGTIEDDLRRRDFTINAIAIRLDGRHFGEVLDPLGGIDDVQRKQVRVLHDRSFKDDPTRMFRAVRYEKRLGFRISRDTIALIPGGARLVGAVSGKRLRNELDLILGEARPAAMLRRLSALGVLQKVHSSLPADSRCLQRLETQLRDDPTANPTVARVSDRGSRWLLWLIGLQSTTLRSIGRRLQLERKLIESLVAAARLFQSAATWRDWRPSELTLKLDEIPEAAIEAVRASLPAGRARQALGTYLRSWRHVRAQSTGHDLRAQGLAPGPRYRSILRSLRSAWIDGDVVDAQGERELLKRLVAGGASTARRTSAR